MVRLLNHIPVEHSTFILLTGVGVYLDDFRSGRSSASVLYVEWLR